MKPPMFFDGILIINIFACRKVWRLLDNRSISTMNGSTLIDDNSGKRPSEVEKLLFVSSTSVYENINKTISESDGAESILNPLLTIENLFRNSGKIKTTIVRLGGLIGYSRNPGKFFIKGRIIHNPDSNVNLIHRDDCIEIISQIVEQEVWGEVFNCCAGTHPTKREFYTQAAKSIGFPVPKFENSNSVSFKIISNKKVKQHLNYKFLYDDLMNIKF